MNTKLSLLLTLLLGWLASLPVTQAATYYGIITNLSNAPNASAQLDVAIDASAGTGAPIDVTVFKADDGTQTDFAILTNDRGFASTALAPTPYNNLFALSGGQTALVRAQTPSGIGAGAAVLRQKVRGQNVLISLAPATRYDGSYLAAGTRVSVAIGDVMSGVYLLIANVTAGQPADVNVFAGTSVVTPRFTNPELGVNRVWQVALTANEAQSYIIVDSSVPVIVQLVVDDGKLDEASLVAQ